MTIPASWMPKAKMSRINANTGAIGVSMGCMGGKEVREHPFVAGPFAMTHVQWDKMVDVVC